jgi:hypothetical protein
MFHHQGEQPNTEWYIMDGNTVYAGPYSREKDAKGQITRIKNGYTPAARRPIKKEV